MFCSKCGKERSEESAFCPHCGAAQDSMVSPRTQNSKRKKSMIVAIICIALAVTIAGSVGIYFLTHRSSHDFRQADWGMTMEEVKKLESADNISEKSNRLNYMVKGNEFLEDYEAETVYTFDAAGKLQSGMVIFTNAAADDALYQQLCEKAEKKYGQPTKTGIASKTHQSKRSEITIFYMMEGTITISYTALSTAD